MKKTYTKPIISVEAMTLNEPIASGCSADPYDMQDLLDFGWFAAEYNCSKYITVGADGQGGYFDYNRDNIPDDLGDYHDKVCYHSNVQTAFLS